MTTKIIQDYLAKQQVLDEQTIVTEDTDYVDLDTMDWGMLLNPQNQTWEILIKRRCNKTHDKPIQVISPPNPFELQFDCIQAQYRACKT